jgi:Zn-dependent metalloprotease
VVTADDDPLMPSRSIERLQQFHAGVPVWGATIVRDLDQSGVPQSFFGTLSPDLTLSVEPGVSAAAARTALLALGGSEAMLLREPALVILRLDSGDHRLAYTAVVAGGADVFRVFIDAQTSVELLRYTELQSQQAIVGTGAGVLGDQKKLSVDASAGAYIAFDRHRPPNIQTFDMRGDPLRWVRLLTRYEDYVMNDYARDSDNVWSDIGIVDAHVHVGWASDYFYKRFGRHGANNMNGPINMLMNRIMQEDFQDYPGSFYSNAFWCSSCGPGEGGTIWFGTGFPKPWYYRSSGQNLNHFSGALDIAVHEYTHAVLTYSSGLIYYKESGALNEAFADIMGMSAEFFYHPLSSTPFTGNEVGKADYVMGEDIQRGMAPWALHGGRSAENPTRHGDPDHYSTRYLGEADNGGVHWNSGIANHAFYLAVEGGTNRTSGLTVQGVGAANRVQIEKVFYRAFVYLLPANATFATARAAMTQAARDLYGAGGAVEVAVTQAWTAVGVF